VHSVLPHSKRSFRFPRASALRFVSVGIAGAALTVLVFGGFFPTSAKATVNADSSLTINWTGDTGSAASLQPDRDTSGFEYNEFKNLKVTVAQTSNLIDQAVRIDMSGFPGGTQAMADGTGQIWSTATNYMQAMECWGDPSSATFRDTCEWGGRFAQNNGLGNSVYGDNVYRVASENVSPSAGGAEDVPFVERDGTSFSGEQDIEGGNKTYPIASVYGVDSSNEQDGARVNADGTGEFDFELHTSIQAPELGCGATSAQDTCYLVLVPRGTVYGGHDASCSQISAPGGHPYSYGDSPAIQGGGPLVPGCDYWNNRIVVPLNFTTVAGACAGGSEDDVIGSQMLIGAMGSWQPALCNTVGAPIDFTTNADSVARAYLLEKRTDVAFTSYPVTKDELQDPGDQTAFDNTTVAYAPVAIGAVTVSFLADGKNGQIDSLVLSPRLLAKLLTQSYIFTIPSDGTDPGNTDSAQLGAVNQSYNHIWDDPDFQALNPNWDQFTNNPSLVLPGPSGADAIEQVWKWIDSDADARNFLNGKPDPWGMTVNPNYLPKGSPGAAVPVFDPTTGKQEATEQPVGFANLDGSGESLADTPLDYFPKADISEVPHTLGIETSRYDSIQAFPYVDDFVTSAVTAFRANPGAKTGWDSTVINSAGKKGDWISGGPQVPGQRFVIAVTDDAATVRYDLDPVGLQAANGTTVTTPTQEAMSQAISSGLVATSVPAVQQVDPSKVSADGYPLTMVIYAAINLQQASSTSSLSAISKMIAYMAGDGQDPGTSVGQLPFGYLPLTSALQSQAATAATAIAAYTPSTSSLGDGSNVGGGSEGDGSDVGGDTSGGSGTSSTSPHVTSLGLSKAGMTPADSTVPFVQVILGLFLGLGLVGAVFAPILVRGVGRSR
jgi:hypothetical protein